MKLQLEIAILNVCCFLCIFTKEVENNVGKQVSRFSHKIDKHLFENNNNSTPSNLIWSPLSVYSTLIPFLKAASSNTLQELQQILGVENQATFDSNALKINKSTFISCTGFFVKRELKISEAFLQSNNFSDIQTFDNSSELIKSINAWVNNATNGIISEIVQNIDEKAKIVVINGVAFKGKWKSKFRKDKSIVKPFQGLSQTSQVEMMQQKSVQNYGRFSTNPNSKRTEDLKRFEVMKMGYKDSSMNIVFVLPEKVENLLPVFSYLISKSEDKLGEILEQLEPTELEIEIPKLKLKSDINIQDALQKAGLKYLFSPISANLSKMFDDARNISMDNEHLHLDTIIHKTTFELDEDGTQAGASTAAVILPLSGLSPKNFTLDKPFIVFLRWRGKLNVFEGIVTDLEQVSNETSYKTNNNNDAPISNLTSRGQQGDWWVHIGPPEYLEEEHTNMKNEEAVIPKLTNTTTMNEKSSKPNNASVKVNYRFQQPEPTDETGIRFPNPNVNNGTRLKDYILGKLHMSKVASVQVSEE